MSFVNVFVARQPVFDRDLSVIGYELLFRSGLENAFPASFDPSQASTRVIQDALLVFGFDVLTAGRLTFVNVTEEVLAQRLYRALPPGRTVLEIVETVEVSPALVEHVRQARLAGFRIALDDFVLTQAIKPLVALADIIKIDVQLSTPAEQAEILKVCAGGTRMFLAEKVETREQFAASVAAGCTYFQGYFFSRPEMMSRVNLPPSKTTHLRFMGEVMREDLDFERLEEILKLDLALSVKLLRYLNSAAFGWRSQVQSLKKAMVLLGERHFRQWAAMMAVVALSEGPEELTLACLARARLCERMADVTSSSVSAFDAFLVGLLSLVDSMLDRPLFEILRELGVGGEVEKALLGKETCPLADLLRLSMAYEIAAWDEVDHLMKHLGIPEDKLQEEYLESLQWARQTLALV